MLIKDTGLRFTFVAFPACLLVSKPSVPLYLTIAYGLSISLFNVLTICYLPIPCTVVAYTVG